jgi:hypothetical protein
MTLDLFDSVTDIEFRREQRGPGATVLRKFAVPDQQDCATTAYCRSRKTITL